MTTEEIFICLILLYTDLSDFDESAGSDELYEPNLNEESDSADYSQANDSNKRMRTKKGMLFSLKNYDFTLFFIWIIDLF